MVIRRAGVDYVEDFFLYFLQISAMASSRSFPRDFSVSTARCFNSLIRFSSILVEKVFFFPISSSYCFFSDITRKK